MHGDRLAEGLSLQGIFDGFVQGPAGETNGTGGDTESRKWGRGGRCGGRGGQWRVQYSGNSTTGSGEIALHCVAVLFSRRPSEIERLHGDLETEPDVSDAILVRDLNILEEDRARVAAALPEVDLFLALCDSG